MVKMTAKSTMIAAILYTAGFLLDFTHARLACKDMDGNDVDWFYIYKLPKIKPSTSSLIPEGLAHFYLDNHQQAFQLSNVSLNDTKGHSVVETLQQIYKRKTDEIAFLMYNDDTSEGKLSLKKGHTKGVVAFDRDTGYWLIHSVPQFPSNISYYWPHNALTYGQSMLCITFSSSSNMDKIAQQMKYNYPYVYAFELPPDVLKIAPTFLDVVNGIHVTESPWFQKVTLVSLAGQPFLNYAKFTKFGKDLYFDLVAPDLKTDLLTETWQNAARSEQLPSNCSGDYHVNNIKGISLQDVEFHSTKDHSKLAISVDPSKAIICVGDINRVSTQFVRGGGTTCALLPTVWKQYSESVSSIEPCP